MKKLSTGERTLIAYKAFSDSAGKAAFFLVTVLAARRLPAEAFGTFALGATIGWLAALLSDAGMQIHLAREAARHPANARALLERWLGVRVASAAATAGGVALLLVTTGAGGPFASALLLFVLAYQVSGLVEFLYFYFRGLGRTDVESTLALGHRTALLALASIALWWRPSVVWLSVAMLVPAVATLLVALAAARRIAPASADDAASAAGLAKGADFARNVLPIGAGLVLAALYFRIDVLLLQAWQGTETVGLYNAVFRIVEALRLFPAAVLAVALPLLVRAADTRPLLRVSAALAGFGAVVAVFLWMVAGWLIPILYGPRFAEAVPAFRVLLLSFPLMSLNYGLTHQLIGWNHHRAYAGLCGGALVFNVVVNARLIPSLSMLGAAWSTVGTEALLTVGCVALLRTRTTAGLTAPGIRQVQQT